MKKKDYDTAPCTRCTKPTRHKSGTCGECRSKNCARCGKVWREQSGSLLCGDCAWSVQSRMMTINGAIA